MTREAVLCLDSFGVAFGERVVLAEITMQLPRLGLTSLVGPMGSGKSTLLRTLAGANDAHPSLAIWGTALIEGVPVQINAQAAGRRGELRPGVGLVMQNARFFLDSVRENVLSALPNRSQLIPGTQASTVRSMLEANGLTELASKMDVNVASLSKASQRQLAIICAVASEPSLLMADEPTANLEDHEAERVLDLLLRQARQRSVLFVTHNQRLAQKAGGTTVFIAGGRVQEIAPAEQFFTAPQSELAKHFVRTGGCVVARPDAKVEELDASVLPSPQLPPTAKARSRFDGPRGFFWLWSGRLGGLPRPGIIRPAEQDLEGLRLLHITKLVTLEETRTVDARLLREHGIESIHFPIVDMGAPELGGAAEFCTIVDRLLQEGHVVAEHCRAGLGRTGTMLACQLIWGGESAREAIEIVRRLNPMCIQSPMQIDFVSAYEQYVQHKHTQPGMARRTSLEQSQTLEFSNKTNVAYQKRRI